MWSGSMSMNTLIKFGGEPSAVESDSDQQVQVNRES
jgi:hypothetical protein